MRTLWSATRDLLQLHARRGRALGDPLMRRWGAPASGSRTMPPLDFCETPEAFIIRIDLPGVTNQFSGLTLTRWSMEGLGASANMEWLNTLTRTRFQPDPVTEVVSMEVDKPAEDWEPVTVVTTTHEIEVPIQADPTQPVIMQTVPISVPEVTVHDVVTVTETVTETFTVEPDPMDVFKAQEFRIEYARTREHLLKDWLMLVGFGMVFGLATAIALRRQDVG